MEITGPSLPGPYNRVNSCETRLCGRPSKHTHDRRQWESSTNTDKQEMLEMKKTSAVPVREEGNISGILLRVSSPHNGEKTTSLSLSPASDPEEPSREKTNGEQNALIPSWGHKDFVQSTTGEQEVKESSQTNSIVSCNAIQKGNIRNLEASETHRVSPCHGQPSEDDDGRRNNESTKDRDDQGGAPIHVYVPAESVKPLLAERMKELSPLQASLHTSSETQPVPPLTHDSHKLSCVATVEENNLIKKGRQMVSLSSETHVARNERDVGESMTCRLSSAVTSDRSLMEDSDHPILAKALHSQMVVSAEERCSKRKTACCNVADHPSRDGHLLPSDTRALDRNHKGNEDGTGESIEGDSKRPQEGYLPDNESTMSPTLEQSSLHSPETMRTSTRYQAQLLYEGKHITSDKATDNTSPSSASMIATTPVSQPFSRSHEQAYLKKGIDTAQAKKNNRDAVETEEIQSTDPSSSSSCRLDSDGSEMQRTATTHFSSVVTTELCGESASSSSSSALSFVNTPSTSSTSAASSSSCHSTGSTFTSISPCLSSTDNSSSSSAARRPISEEETYSVLSHQNQHLRPSFDSSQETVSSRGPIESSQRRNSQHDSDQSRSCSSSSSPLLPSPSPLSSCTSSRGKEGYLPESSGCKASSTTKSTAAISTDVTPSMTHALTAAIQSTAVSSSTPLKTGTVQLTVREDSSYRESIPTRMETEEERILSRAVSLNEKDKLSQEQKEKKHVGDVSLAGGTIDEKMNDRGESKRTQATSKQVIPSSPLQMVQPPSLPTVDATCERRKEQPEEIDVERQEGKRCPLHRRDEVEGDHLEKKDRSSLVDSEVQTDENEEKKGKTSLKMKSRGDSCLLLPSYLEKYATKKTTNSKGENQVVSDDELMGMCRQFIQLRSELVRIFDQTTLQASRELMHLQGGTGSASRTGEREEEGRRKEEDEGGNEGEEKEDGSHASSLPKRRSSCSSSVSQSRSHHHARGERQTGEIQDRFSVSTPPLKERVSERKSHRVDKEKEDEEGEVIDERRTISEERMLYVGTSHYRKKRSPSREAVATSLSLERKEEHGRGREGTLRRKKEKQHEELKEEGEESQAGRQHEPSEGTGNGSSSSGASSGEKSNRGDATIHEEGDRSSHIVSKASPLPSRPRSLRIANNNSRRGRGSPGDVRREGKKEEQEGKEKRHYDTHTSSTSDSQSRHSPSSSTRPSRHSSSSSFEPSSASAASSSPLPPCQLSSVLTPEKSSRTTTTIHHHESRSSPPRKSSSSRRPSSCCSPSSSLAKLSAISSSCEKNFQPSSSSSSSSSSSIVTRRQSQPLSTSSSCSSSSSSLSPSSGSKTRDSNHSHHRRHLPPPALLSSSSSSSSSPSSHVSPVLRDKRRRRKRLPHHLFPSSAPAFLPPLLSPETPPRPPTAGGAGDLLHLFSPPHPHLLRETSQHDHHDKEGEENQRERRRRKNSPSSSSFSPSSQPTSSSSHKNASSFFSQTSPSPDDTENLLLHPYDLMYPSSHDQSRQYLLHGGSSSRSIGCWEGVGGSYFGEFFSDDYEDLSYGDDSDLFLCSLPSSSSGDFFLTSLSAQSTPERPLHTPPRSSHSLSHLHTHVGSPAVPSLSSFFSSGDHQRASQNLQSKKKDVVKGRKNSFPEGDDEQQTGKAANDNGDECGAHYREGHQQGERDRESSREGKGEGDDEKKKKAEDKDKGRQGGEDDEESRREKMQMQTSVCTLGVGGRKKERGRLSPNPSVRRARSSSSLSQSLQSDMKSNVLDSTPSEQSDGRSGNYRPPSSLLSPSSRHEMISSASSETRDGYHDKDMKGDGLPGNSVVRRTSSSSLTIEDRSSNSLPPPSDPSGEHLLVSGGSRPTCHMTSDSKNHTKADIEEDHSLSRESSFSYHNRQKKRSGAPGSQGNGTGTTRSGEEEEELSHLGITTYDETEKKRRIGDGYSSFHETEDGECGSSKSRAYHPTQATTLATGGHLRFTSPFSSSSSTFASGRTSEGCTYTPYYPYYSSHAGKHLQEDTKNNIDPRKDSFFSFGSSLRETERDQKRHDTTDPSTTTTTTTAINRTMTSSSSSSFSSSSSSSAPSIQISKQTYEEAEYGSHRPSPRSSSCLNACESSLEGMGEGHSQAPQGACGGTSQSDEDLPPQAVQQDERRFHRTIGKGRKREGEVAQEYYHPSLSRDLLLSTHLPSETSRREGSSTHLSHRKTMIPPVDEEESSQIYTASHRFNMKGLPSPGGEREEKRRGRGHDMKEESEENHPCLLFGSEQRGDPFSTKEEEDQAARHQGREEGRRDESSSSQHHRGILQEERIRFTSNHFSPPSSTTTTTTTTISTRTTTCSSSSSSSSLFFPPQESLRQHPYHPHHLHPHSSHLYSPQYSYSHDGGVLVGRGEERGIGLSAPFFLSNFPFSRTGRRFEEGEERGIGSSDFRQPSVIEDDVVIPFLRVASSPPLSPTSTSPKLPLHSNQVSNSPLFPSLAQREGGSQPSDIDDKKGLLNPGDQRGNPSSSSSFLFPSSSIHQSQSSFDSAFLMPHNIGIEGRGGRGNLLPTPPSSAQAGYRGGSETDDQRISSGENLSFSSRYYSNTDTRSTAGSGGGGGHNRSSRGGGNRRSSKTTSGRTSHQRGARGTRRASSFSSSSSSQLTCYNEGKGTDSGSLLSTELNGKRDGERIDSEGEGEKEEPSRRRASSNSSGTGGIVVTHHPQAHTSLPHSQGDSQLEDSPPTRLNVTSSSSSSLRGYRSNRGSAKDGVALLKTEGQGGETQASRGGGGGRGRGSGHHPHHTAGGGGGGSGNSCRLCRTRQTPQWRYLDGLPVCNACYMRARKKQQAATGLRKPVSLAVISGLLPNLLPPSSSSPSRTTKTNSMSATLPPPSPPPPPTTTAEHREKANTGSHVKEEEKPLTPHPSSSPTAMEASEGNRGCPMRTTEKDDRKEHRVWTREEKGGGNEGEMLGKTSEVTETPDTMKQDGIVEHRESQMGETDDMINNTPERNDTKRSATNRSFPSLKPDGRPHLSSSSSSPPTIATRQRTRGVGERKPGVGKAASARIASTTEGGGGGRTTRGKAQAVSLDETEEASHPVAPPSSLLSDSSSSLIPNTSNSAERMNGAAPSGSPSRNEQQSPSHGMGEKEEREEGRYDSPSRFKEEREGARRESFSTDNRDAEGLDKEGREMKKTSSLVPNSKKDIQKLPVHASTGVLPSCGTQSCCPLDQHIKGDGDPVSSSSSLTPCGALATSSEGSSFVESTSTSCLQEVSMGRGTANFKTSGKEPGEAEEREIGGPHLSVCGENEVKKKSLSGETQEKEEGENAGSVITPYMKESEFCLGTSEDQHAEKNQGSCEGRRHRLRDKTHVKEKEKERVSCCQGQRETSFHVSVPTDGRKEKERKEEEFHQYTSAIEKQEKPRHDLPSGRPSQKSSYSTEENTHGQIILSANTTTSSSSLSSSASVSTDDRAKCSSSSTLYVDSTLPSLSVIPTHQSSTSSSPSVLSSSCSSSSSATSSPHLSQEPNVSGVTSSISSSGATFRHLSLSSSTSVSSLPPNESQKICSTPTTTTPSTSPALLSSIDNLPPIMSTSAVSSSSLPIVRQETSRPSSSSSSTSAMHAPPSTSLLPATTTSGSMELSQDLSMSSSSSFSALQQTIPSMSPFVSPTPQKRQESCLSSLPDASAFSGDFPSREQPIERRQQEHELEKTAACEEVSSCRLRKEKETWRSTKAHHDRKEGKTLPSTKEKTPMFTHTPPPPPTGSERGHDADDDSKAKKDRRDEKDYTIHGVENYPENAVAKTSHGLSPDKVPRPLTLSHDTIGGRLMTGENQRSRRRKLNYSRMIKDLGGGGGDGSDEEEEDEDDDEDWVSSYSSRTSSLKKRRRKTSGALSAGGGAGPQVDR